MRPYHLLPERMAIGYITFCSISLLSYLAGMCLGDVALVLLPRCSIPAISCEQEDIPHYSFLPVGLLTLSLALLSLLGLASIKNSWALNQCPRLQNVDAEQFFQFKRGVFKSVVGDYLIVIVMGLLPSGFSVFAVPDLVDRDTYSSINFGTIAALLWLGLVAIFNCYIACSRSIDCRERVTGLRPSFLAERYPAVMEALARRRPDRDHEAGPSSGYNRLSSSE